MGSIGSVLHLILVASSLFFDYCIAFNPTDNYLIDCGSATNTSIGNRIFLADFYFISNISTSKSIFTDIKPLFLSSFDSSILYETARIIFAPFSYSFRIFKHGNHFLRLYFSPFMFQNNAVDAAYFSVSIAEFVILSEFRSRSSSAAVFKEYLLSITTDLLTLTFTPLGNSSFAFVNAVELVSIPDDLIGDNVLELNPAGTYGGLSQGVLETVYRINMGGPKVFPDQDPLWRTWITDESFLMNRDFAKFVNSSETIHYGHGGATEQIAPPSVYSTGTELVASNAFHPVSNLTWKFNVDAGSSFVIRLHFCNIVSQKLNQLYFDVYINDFLAIKDLNLSRRPLAVPFYADFVVRASDVYGEIRVSISCSSRGNVSPDGILNGLEIMSLKMPSDSSNGNNTIFANNFSKKKLGVILGSLNGALLLVIITVFLCIVIKRRRKT